MSCRFRGRTDRPEDAAKNVSNPEGVGLDAGVGDDDDVEDAGGEEEGGEAGLAGGESRVCFEAAPVQSGPRLPPLSSSFSSFSSFSSSSSGLRTLTLGVTAPSLPCSTTDFTKVGIFSWFLACRGSPGHLAGLNRWKFWKSLELTLVLASFKSWQRGKENYHNNDLGDNESL